MGSSVTSRSLTLAPMLAEPRSSSGASSVTVMVSLWLATLSDRSSVTSWPESSGTPFLSTGAKPGRAACTV
jgi:hypothetical protein